MVFDFGGLDKPKARVASANPRDIFRSRPSGKAKIKELWQGQAQALDDWFKNPKQDTLISMYTGAGKTLVGVLIAQSYLLQGVRNVVYVCPTIDLIHQTVKEANGIGIMPTTYHQGEFSDQNFAQSKSFCVTTYQALFNTRNKFRGQYAPGAIIFDDAHVGERLVREAFTLTIVKHKHEELFRQLSKIVQSCFQDVGQSYNFEQVMSDFSAGSVALCPPNGVYNRSHEIENAIAPFAEPEISLRLPFDYLRGHIQYCAITISKNLIEICPPFIPALQVRALEDKSIPKVFLSATVQSKGDITRAFGRSPIVIEPDVDAGLGERLMLFSSALNGYCADTKGLATLAQKTKVLIATPAERKANNWDDLAIPPKNAEAFTQKLNEFRTSTSGAFVLVGRYDGIDLPDDDCRVMVVDGVPVGAAQLEKYLFEKIKLDQTFFPRVANRFTQLFGRINRGKNDYGIYFIFSPDAENWLRNASNQAYFPKILQEQIRLSEEFCDQLSGMTPETVEAIVTQIIERDPKWLGYYQAQIGQNPIDEKRIRDREDATQFDDELAKREANFILKLWQGDASGARNELEAIIEQVRVQNPRLAGWYAIWLGAANCIDNETEAMFDWFDEARNRLGGNLPLPRRSREDVGVLAPPIFAVEEGLREFCALKIPQTNRKISKIIENTANALKDAPHRKAEESVRIIGSVLGFDSRRPDTDENDGPDNLWVDHHKKVALPIELKTDKVNGNPVNSEEVGQIYQHLEWTRNQYPGYTVPGILVYTESSTTTDSSNPSSDMYFCNRAKIKNLIDAFISSAVMISKISPLEGYAKANEIGSKEEWSLIGIFESLKNSSLK